MILYWGDFMKKVNVLLLCALLPLAAAGCGHSVKEEPADTWDCTVTSAEESGENAYVITYSDAEVTSRTGVLTAENQSDFTIAVHISAAGEELVQTIAPEGTAKFQNLLKDQIYQVGLHAEVEEGTEIRARLYDGETGLTAS